MEKVILVDANNRAIGEMEKQEAHEKAELHRAVSVFIFNSNNQLLLQRRALSKYHSPGLWTNTACTHPRMGETNEQASIRRLKEEMDIEATTLTKIFDFIYKEELEHGLTEHELDHVFVGFSDVLPTPEPEEVCEYKYVEIDSILEQIQKAPTDYTVWFKQIIERVLNTFDNQS